VTAKPILTIVAALGLLACPIALSAPVPAQPVTLADLEGIIVEANVRREQKVRRPVGPATVTIQQAWRLSIEAQQRVEFRIETTAQTPRGTRKAEPDANALTLEEPQAVGSRGGGEALFKFADETLTFIRTFPAGAYRLNFKFARGPAGLTCTVTEAFAREDGKGELKMKSAFGGEVTVLSTRQLPSTCNVTAKK
jgi:hypothetical protein